MGDYWLLYFFSMPYALCLFSNPQSEILNPTSPFAEHSCGNGGGPGFEPTPEGALGVFPSCGNLLEW
jgi:hypothetical protein